MDGYRGKERKSKPPQPRSKEAEKIVAENQQNTPSVDVCHRRGERGHDQNVFVSGRFILKPAYFARAEEQQRLPEKKKETNKKKGDGAIAHLKRQQHTRFHPSLAAPRSCGLSRLRVVKFPKAPAAQQARTWSLEARWGLAGSAPAVLGERGTRPTPRGFENRWGQDRGTTSLFYRGCLSVLSCFFFHLDLQLRTAVWSRGRGNESETSGGGGEERFLLAPNA